MATASLENLQRPRIPFIKSKADEMTKFYTSPPIPVVDVAESQGIKVTLLRLKTFGGEIAAFADFKDGKIYANADDPPIKQTYGIAHELGHWLLHGEFFRKHEGLYAALPRFREPKRTPYEEEARLFAANLLIPSHLLAPVKNKAPLPILAKLFAVSPELMEYRLRHG